MEQTYMRKSDPAFMQYQQDDTTRRQRHREQARAVKQANDERIRETCCAADTRSDEQEAARLARKGEAKQRYQERAVMYERARGTGLGGASLFGRLNIFTEQEHPQQLRAGDGA